MAHLYEAGASVSAGAYNEAFGGRWLRIAQFLLHKQARGA